MMTSPNGAWFVLKVRLHPDKGPRDYDFRSVRAMGRYATFHDACTGAARACKAAHREEDAGRFRYLVRHESRAPRKVLIDAPSKRTKAWSKAA